MNVHDLPGAVVSRTMTRDSRTRCERASTELCPVPPGAVHVSPLVQVAEFHRRFGVAIGVPLSDEPTAALRLALIEEELAELRDALAASDIIAVADALADLAYVINGAALTWGIDLDAALVEVHRSNMTKMPANGQPVKHPAGKILKGPDYEPPDLTAAVAGCPG